MNLLSFVTNRRRPLDLSTESRAKTLTLVGAEIERVSFCVELGPPDKLSEAIRSSSSLTLIAKNLVRERSGLLITLKPVLQSAKSIKKLIVQDAAPSIDVLNKLAELLNPIPDLEVSLKLSRDDGTLTAPLIDALRKIRSLRKLDTSNNRVDVLAFRDALKTDWKNLQSLTMAQPELGPSVAWTLGYSFSSAACGLRTLDLRHTDLDDSGIADMVNGLLRGYSRAPGGGKGALRKLNLCCNRIRETGAIKAAQLVKSNPHLTLINMSGNRIGTAGTIFGESLQNCAATLRKLKLNSCYLSAESVIAICHSLSGSYSLSVLKIAFSQLEDSAEAAIRAITRDLLVAEGSIIKLDISNIDINGSVANGFVEGFARNGSLKKVVLDCSWGMGMSNVITELFGAMLHLELRGLGLHCCHIDDAGYEAIGKFIAVSPQLRKLSMHGSILFSTDGIMAISEAVAQSRSIEGLNLSGCVMGDKGMRCVANWIIGGSKTIQELDISYTDMGIEGAKAVAKAARDVAGKSALRRILACGYKKEEDVYNVLEITQEAVKNYIRMVLAD